MSELKNQYGENTSWFCYEGSVTLKDTTDGVGTIEDCFDVYGENERGEDNCASIDVIGLLESAHVVMEQQSTELEQLRKERDEAKEALNQINSLIDGEKVCNAGLWDEEFGVGGTLDDIQALAKLNQQGN